MGAQAVGQRVVGEHPRQGAGEGTRITGLDQERVDAVGRDVAVAVETAGDDGGAGGHRLDQHHAEGLAVERRGAEHRGATEPSELLGVVDAAEPRDPVVFGVAGPQCRSVRPVAGDPQPGVARQSAERLHEHGEALAFLVAPAEEDRRPAGRDRPCAGDRCDVDAVEEHPVVAPEVRLHEREGVLGDDDLDVDVADRPGQEALEHAIARRRAGGVERCDQRGAAEEQRRHRRPGGERFVDVQDVELLVAQGPDRTQRGGRVGGQGSDRSVGGGRQAVAERRDERLRWGTVTGSEHASLVPVAPQLAGEADDLGLDAAGNAQAVGGDQTDTQSTGPIHADEPIRSGRAACGRAPFAGLQLGNSQFRRPVRSLTGRF